jgi:hypothetical protein
VNITGKDHGPQKGNRSRQEGGIPSNVSSIPGISLESTGTEQPNLRIMAKFMKFKTKKSELIASRAKFVDNAKTISKVVVPAVIEKIQKESDYVSIPGPSASLLEKQLENKLMSFDRKVLRDYERLLIATRIDQQRRYNFTIAMKYLQYGKTLSRELRMFSGSSYALTEDMFFFSDQELSRGTFENRRFSFPKIYWGDNSLLAYDFEYSTRKSNFQSDVSWCLSSGMTNPQPFTMYTDLIPDAQFWATFGIVAEVAKRYASQKWFLASIEAMHRFKLRPIVSKVPKINYPPKRIYGKSEQGLRVEIFGSIYIIEPRIFYDYHHLLRRAPLKFLVFACARQHVHPSISDAELLEAAESTDNSIVADHTQSVEQFDPIIEYNARYGDIVATKRGGKCDHDPPCEVYESWSQTMNYWVKRPVCNFHRTFGRNQLTKETAHWMAKNIPLHVLENTIFYFLFPPDVARIRSYIGDNIAIQLIGFTEIDAWFHQASFRNRLNQDVNVNPAVVRRLHFSRDIDKFLEAVLPPGPDKTRILELWNRITLLQVVDQVSVTGSGSIFNLFDMPAGSLVSDGEPVLVPDDWEPDEFETNLMGFDFDQIFDRERFLDEYTSDVRFWGRRLVFPSGVG